MFGSEQISREILGNVPGWLVLIFYGLAVVCCGLAGEGFRRRCASYRKSRRLAVSPQPSGNWSERVMRVVRYLVFQEQLRRDPYAGWSHLLTVSGFFILFVGTCLVFLEHDTPLHFYYGWFYQIASLVIDLGGVAFLAGLSMFLARRCSTTSRRILREWWVTALSGLLLAIGLSGFLLEAARIAVALPTFERFSVIGYGLALVFREMGIRGDVAKQCHVWLWGGHAAVCLAFFLLLPWGFFSHLVYSAMNVAAWRPRRFSRLFAVPLDSEQSPGAVTWQDFSPVDLLQADACTTCGRCNDVCPAAQSGKPLRPRNVVLELRHNHTRHEHDSASAPLQLADDVLWSCTTCAACNHACPVGIDVYEKIIELRRGKVEAGAVPVAAENVFEDVTERDNPYGRPNSERLAWAQGLNLPVAEADEQTELLYWIGCSGSFSPEGQSVARSMVKILNHLGINYRVLGPAERCTGDPARRMGEEGLYQSCAKRNLEVFRKHGVKRILTHCPHCLNTMQNEYPDLSPTPESSASWTVVHHTQFLAEQAASGKLRGSARLTDTVTFHDPCYLGRGNGIVDEPRSVLQQLKLPIVEMPRTKGQSFCCGAGGGSIWLDVRGEERIEHQRFREAADTGAQIIGTGCPFCKTMLDAARQAADTASANVPKVMDVAELVVRAEGL